MTKQESHDFRRGSIKHIYHKEDAEVVRIEGEAPRTLYTLVEPNTVGTEHFSMGLEEIDPHSEIPLHSTANPKKLFLSMADREKRMSVMKLLI